MITITPDDVREFGDLPKEEFIDNGKIEKHIKVANNDYLGIFPDDFVLTDLTPKQIKRLNDSVEELKIRLTLISIIPFVNTMYVDGFAKYGEGDTLGQRFYAPHEVKGLVRMNSDKNIKIIANIEKITKVTAVGIVKDKSGISFTVIGGGQ